MTKLNSELFQVRFTQVRQYSEVDLSVDERRGVLAEPKPFRSAADREMIAPVSKRAPAHFRYAVACFFDGPMPSL